MKPGDLCKNLASGKCVRILKILPRLEDDRDVLLDEPCAAVEDVPTEKDTIGERLLSLGFHAYTPLSNLAPWPKDGAS